MLNRTGNTLSILYNNAQFGIIFGIFLIALVPMTAWAITETLKFDGVDYLIEYTTVNMDVYDMYIDTSSKSLILDFDMLEEGIGMLDITIERALLDSVLDGGDAFYRVVIDDILADDVRELSSNDQLRTLSITVPSGSFSVEIIGNVLADDNAEPIEPIVEEPIVDEPIESITPIETEPIEPIVEEPIVDEPIESITPIETEPIEPIVDEPIESITPIETEPIEPIVDEPIADGCGPGTILQDGVCIIDESVVEEPLADGCGPGTILQDGVCIIDESVVDEPPKKTTTNMSIVISVAFAFMIAGGVATVLALIAKASKRS